MPQLSTKSKAILATCHPDLQRVVHAAIADCPVDFAVLCGHRGQEDQHSAFLRGYSKVDWPNSNHNSLPSVAVDLAPWPIDWEPRRFCLMAGWVLAKAHALGIKLRWGGDWNGNGIISEHRFVDLPHFELRK